MLTNPTNRRRSASSSWSGRCCPGESLSACGRSHEVTGAGAAAAATGELLPVLLHQPLRPLAAVEQIPAAEVTGHARNPVTVTTPTMGAALRSPVELGEDVDGRRVVPAARPEHLQVHGGRPVQVRPLAPALSGLDQPQRLLFLGLLPLWLLPTLRAGARHGAQKLQDSPVGRKVTASRRRESGEREREELQMGLEHNQAGWEPPAPLPPDKTASKILG